ncbi:hypothetical protein FTV88_2232 [Heliorestis convoluta]|uniref:Uncharacterized protein n=1 Tax=Heliorestis convoluta TaxID=356322 RepID=A0A5Q2N7U2_9FIRM|nr:hypothetical protein FTV88_2232 [Heliorestis convoluta]
MTNFFNFVKEKNDIYDILRHYFLLIMMILLFSWLFDHLIWRNHHYLAHTAVEAIAIFFAFSGFMYYSDFVPPSFS